MSSLRLALKLSRAENNNKSDSNDDFDEYKQSLLKINTKIKRKRNVSIDSKKSLLNDDNDNTNMSSNMSINDELTDKSFDNNILDEIKENSNIIIMKSEDNNMDTLDSGNELLQIDDQSLTTEDQAIDSNRNTDIEDVMFSDDIYFRIDSTNSTNSEDHNNENTIIDQNDDIVYLTNNTDSYNNANPDNKDDNNQLDKIEESEDDEDEDDVNDSNEIDSDDNDNENENDNEDNVSKSKDETEVVIKVRRRGKRKSGILRSLGISSEEEDSLNRQPHRAAAMLAKTKLAIKPLRRQRSSSSNIATDVKIEKPIVEKIDMRRKQFRADRINKLDSQVDSKSDSKSESKSDSKVDTKIDSKSTDPADVSDNPWVQCDQCQKWRKLPKHIDPSNLPEKWYCTMNIWDVKHNQCTDDEERENDEINRNDSLDTIDKNVTTHVRNKPGPKPKNRFKTSISSTNIPISTDVKDVKIENKIEPKIDSKIDSKSESKIDNKIDDSELTLRPSLKRKSSNNSFHSINKRVNISNNPSTNTTNQSSNNIELDKTDWVECCKCNKWRKVPSYISINELPDVWECSLNTWSSYYSKCSSKQEVDDKSNIDMDIDNYNSNISNTSSSQISNLTNQTVKKVIQWVQCERKSCQKWRKIPSYLNLTDLPEKWFCEYNTWDRDRSTCDAIEESDEENDIIISNSIIVNNKSNKNSNTNIKTSNNSNNSLIGVNSKSINTLSYRRLIFGNDGKVRPMYNEKSKTGYGIFSYIDNYKTIGEIRKNIRLNYTFANDLTTNSIHSPNKYKGRLLLNQKSSNDDDDNANQCKRVAYWYSSHYNKNGLFYTSSTLSSKRGNYNKYNSDYITNLSNHFNYDEYDYSDSILNHLFPSNNSNSNYIAKSNNMIDTYLDVNIDDSIDIIKKSSSDEKVPTLPLKQLNTIYPKKIINSSSIIQNKINSLSIFEKHTMVCSMIRTVLLFNDTMSLSIDICYNMLKTCYYHNIYYNYYKNVITYYSFINCCRYLDDLGEVFITTDLYGLSIISYNYPVDNNICKYIDSKDINKNDSGNDFTKARVDTYLISPDTDSNTCDVLLPPKLRNKKYFN